MKKYFILLTLSTIFLCATEVQDKLSALLNSPTPKYNLKVSYDPFIKSQNLINSTFDSTQKDAKLQINSILNSKAYIDSKWRVVGDEVLGYKIIKIDVNYILTNKDGKLIKFELKPSNTLLKVRNIEK